MARVWFIFFLTGGVVLVGQAMTAGTEGDRVLGYGWRVHQSAGGAEERRDGATVDDAAGSATQEGTDRGRSDQH